MQLVKERTIRAGTVVPATGEIDLATAPALEQKLLRAEQSHRVVALDLRDTSFMDSAGVHLIIAATERLRERGGRLIVANVPSQIHRLFELTHAAPHIELVHDGAELEHRSAASR